MEIWEAAVLGLLQGLTEFLPVSSSAHLRIAGAVMPAAHDPGAAFTAIVQIGTELAVLLYFRREILAIWRAMARQIGGRAFDADAARLGWLIAIGTLPIVGLGLAFADLIETALRNLYVTAAMLIAFGIVLGLADRFGSRKKALRQLGWRAGILLGFAQALALIPGVSRSGATISAGLLLGFRREDAARYAFLLAIPAVFGSGFYQLFKSMGVPDQAGLAPTAVGTAVAFLSGYMVIVAFMRLITTASFLPFVCYRIGLGLILLALLLTGGLAPV
ncbi:undecaprenyl-diphosphatase UppP [Gemmobacter sp. 24YEA27]|uniref:undecaprenyl-diphosphatase UppP n=1 Tax=Gemmobacter sp. 24YEA27 TaxID=3040672 RepID=UPI0024B35400|nr:undecaprenyl-diphosphatase UppP [Gemmobacter sp. 24YEA27]